MLFEWDNLLTNFFSLLRNSDFVLHGLHTNLHKIVKLILYFIRLVTTLTLGIFKRIFTYISFHKETFFTENDKQIMESQN